MFSNSILYYDKIYADKDYRDESQRLIAIIDANLRSNGKGLLDVACGTGHHIGYLKARFDVEGVDLSEDMLDVARQRHPDISFQCADMTSFDLRRKFDVVTCLFSSIGYVKTPENLAQAVTSMARHLVPGGLLLIEPWLTPDNFRGGVVHAKFVDEPGLKIARMNTSAVQERISILDFHYLIATPEGTEYFTERHELGLFETGEMHSALADAGLKVTYDTQGFTDRGLFIGRRPN